MARQKKNDKDRRGSGWTTPTTTLTIPKKEIIAMCLEPQPYWDDWIDWRDSFRGHGDQTLIGDNIGYSYDYETAEKKKKRLKALEHRRRIRQNSPRNQE